MERIIIVSNILLSVILAQVGDAKTANLLSLYTRLPDYLANIDRCLADFQTTKETVLYNTYYQATMDLSQQKNKILGEIGNFYSDGNLAWRYNCELISEAWKKADTQIQNCYQEHFTRLCQTINFALEKRDCARASIDKCSNCGFREINNYHEIVNHLKVNDNLDESIESLMKKCINCAFDDFSQTTKNVCTCIVPDYRRWYSC